MNEYSWNLDSGPYLQHFGILGMKWGVRRYQNADGSYTNAGKDRYFNGHDYKKQKVNVKTKKTSDAYLQDVAKAKSKGMSDEDAEATAERKQKIRKAIAISAGIAVTAIATYAGVKYYKDNIQDVIVGTASTPLKRIQTFDGKHNFNGPVYAANAKDNARYIDWWGKTQYKNLNIAKQFAEAGLRDKSVLNNDVYNMDLVYNGGKGVKVASTTHAKKIFNQMVKNDPEFKGQVEAMIKKGEMINKGETKRGRNLYDKFNIYMAGEGRKSDAAQKFYQTMKERGYGGIKDVNDNKYSGFHTKSAALIFSGKYDWKAHKLTDDDFVKAADANAKFAIELEAKKAIGETAGIYGALGAIGVAASRTKTGRAKSMRNAGVPVSKIAKQLGISESEVYALTSDSKK